MPPQPPSRFQLAELFVPEIKELIAEKNFKEVKRIFKTLSCVDMAGAWSRFTPPEQTAIFRLLSDSDASALFQELALHEQTHLMTSLGDTELKGVWEDLPPEEVTKLFRQLPPRTLKSMARFMEKNHPEAERNETEFPQNTVGSWMQFQTVDLQPQLTTQQALEKIRNAVRLSQGGGPDGYYVTDKSGRLLGWVTLRELIAAPPKLKLAEYMSPVRLVRLNPEQDQEDAIILFTKYQLSMAPVVDKEDRLLGYIRSEDILPLAQREVTEDFAKMAGTGVEDYESESVWRVARLRLPWLIATCCGGLMVSAVVKHFDYLLGQVIVLAAFMPLIAAMGGNVGSQASTVLVRALALREQDFSDRWRLLFHEVSVGMTLGTFYGTLMGGIAYLLYGQEFGLAFSLVVGFGMLVSMTIATAMGVMVPLTLVRFGIDPATATGPLITTTTDLISVTSYFLLALWLLV
jgi:magnesium transporter